MKCTLCGCEIPEKSDICTNCGTKVSEMGGSARKKSAPMNQETVNENISFAPVNKTARKNDPRGLITVIAIVLMLGIVYFLYSSVLTQKIDEGLFTASIPMNMHASEKSSDDIETSGKRKVYSNSRADFGYIVIDLSSITKTYSDMMTDSMFMNSLDKKFSKSELLKSYEKISLNENKLECYYVTKNGKKIFTKLYCRKTDDKMIIFITACTENDKDKISSKMDKWLNSIIIK